jgi:ribosomal protein S27AE
MRDTETDDDGFGEDSGESALPPAAASFMTQGVRNSQDREVAARLRYALASSGLSSSFSSREIEAVSVYLAANGLDDGFVTWAIGKAREPSVRNPGGFLKSALTGRGDFADFPERYREESRPQQQEPQRSRAPSTCPKCGKKLKATSDRAACKACGLMLEYDESLDDWAEADEGLAAGADQVLAAIGVRR